MKFITENNSKILIYFGVFLIIIGIIFFFLAVDLSATDKIDTSKFSEFGDYFGGVVGAIWSLAGVMLFYIALDEQRKDIRTNQQALQQQIIEFQHQRQELSDTREVFIEQSLTLKVQRFENTFFQLLNLYNEIISNLQFSISGKVCQRRDAFSEYADILNTAFSLSLNKYEEDGFGGHKISETIELNSVLEVEPIIKSIYRNFFFNTTKQRLSNYHRNIFHILKFIYKSDLIEETSENFYASILRAQLSSDELFLMFYNSIDERFGYPKMLYLIKRFDLMQNFDLGLISVHKFHFEIFQKKILELPDFEI